MTNSHLPQQAEKMPRKPQDPGTGPVMHPVKKAECPAEPRSQGVAGHPLQVQAESCSCGIEWLGRNSGI